MQLCNGVTINFFSIEIIEPPQNVSVGLDSSGRVTLTCRVRGENIFLRVDGDIFDHNNLGRFRDRGITFSNAVESNNVITQSVEVDSTETNNNTVVICYASSQDFPVESSDSATIFIAGTWCVH